MNKLLSIVIVLAAILVISTCYVLPGQEKLQFRKDEKGHGYFKIAHFTDLHFGEDDSLDAKTKHLMSLVLEQENPDFLAIGGDVISDYSSTGPYPKPRPWVEKHYSDAMSAIAGKIRWGLVLGNHDLGTTYGGAELAELDFSFNGSLTSAQNDVNYILQVFGPDGLTPWTNLYMMNTHNYTCLGATDGYGCPSPAQVQWYRQSASGFKSKFSTIVPALAFMHIPMQEMIELFNGKEIDGYKHETMCCHRLNTGLYAAMLEAADVKAVTFGHDHGNDYIGELHGLNLAYGRKTGYGSYNMMLQGSRIYQVEVGAGLPPPPHGKIITRGLLHPPLVPSPIPYRIVTWLRLADGKIETQKRMHHQGHEVSCCLG